MDLRERFNSITSDQIVAMVGEQETLRLDFKRWSSNDHDNRKSLSEAISGFANSDGGLIIWGVDARKGDDGIDRAENTPGLDADRALNLLNEWTADAVSPRQPGVDHRQVSSADGIGFVISYMPMTLGEPVMAHDKRFYHRCGTRFMQMEQYHVSNMYGRRAKPSLVASVGIKQRLHEYSGWGLWLSFSICNEGIGTAHDIQFVIGTTFAPKQVSGAPGWEPSARLKLAAMSGVTNQSVVVPKDAGPLHPGVERAAVRVDVVGVSGQLHDLHFRCVAMCNEAPPAISDLVITRDDINAALQ